MVALYTSRSGEKLIGKRVSEDEVEKTGNGYPPQERIRTIRVDARSFKMTKSRGNVVNPDDIVRDYGADAFRLYEMYMGPLEAAEALEHARHRRHEPVSERGLAEPGRR